MVSTILNLILAILRAFPVVQGWFEGLVTLYIKSEIARMKEENKQVLLHTVTAHCQIELEKLIGYTNAGKPSGLPGAIIVPELPNVAPAVDHTPPESKESEVHHGG